mmetsp:Transcript_81257/g.233524  ORF Transcript_81257/g.233524 Transcript_81257/m.233524 type:complete len:272 (+) Transcript_81257:911-1726(+)
MARRGLPGSTLGSRPPVAHRLQELLQLRPLLRALHVHDSPLAAGRQRPLRDNGQRRSRAAPPRGGGAVPVVRRDPAPSQVDSSLRDPPLGRHPVQVVLLHQALHGAKVAVPKGHARGVQRIILGPHLELARCSQRQGNDQRILPRGLEQRLVIRVPAHRLGAVLVEVRVARVRQLADAASLTDCLGDLQEPRLHGVSLPTRATVLVCAAAAFRRQEGCAPGQQPGANLWPVPLDAALQTPIPALQLLRRERRPPQRHEAPPPLVAERQLPT